MLTGNVENRVETVESLDDWSKSIQSLGAKNHVATIWPILSSKEALAQPITETTPGYLTPESPPRGAILAALTVANLISKEPIGSDTIRRPLVMFGRRHPVTGLHADINFANREAQSPPITTLYVARGAIRAYFRAMPLDAIKPNSQDVADAFFSEFETSLPMAHNGIGIREDKKKFFTSVDAHAGTVLAFPAAGNYSRKIAPVAHQIETLPEYGDRITVAMPYTIFKSKALV